MSKDLFTLAREGAAEVSPFDGVNFRPVKEIAHKVHASQDFAHAVQLPGFQSFIDGLPDVLAAKELKALIAAIRLAKEKGKPIIWAMGAHSIKCGLTPWLLAMAREGFITAMAFNGACVIHDLELALAAETSEDVAEHLSDGLFGTADEPGRLIGEALSAAIGVEAASGKGATSNKGFGQIVTTLLASEKFPRRDLSLMAGCCRLGIPVTFHAALGTDTIHFHPAVDWSLLGKSLQLDFEDYVAEIAELNDGGVYLNVGSAVLLPEVFLKALTINRNMGKKVNDFTTANLDMVQHYRPRVNVLSRPGGQAIALTGHHEIMIPLLACALLSGKSRVPEKEEVK